MAMVAAIDSDSCRQQAFAGIYCVPLGIFVDGVSIVLLSTFKLYFGIFLYCDQC